VNRYGCPLGLKSNTWVSLLAPIVSQPNFTLQPNTVVTHLEGQLVNGQYKATRAVVRDAAGREDTIEADLIIVACSAIESVKLLLISAERNGEFAQRVNPNGLLGRYFLTHCFGGASGLMPEAVDKSLSVDSDWATDACATPAYIRSKGLWAGGAIYNNTSDQALPISVARTYRSMDMDTIWNAFTGNQDLRGEALMNWLVNENLGRRLSVSFMANQLPLPTNRIELHPTVRDKWNLPSAYIIKDWHPHDRLMMDTLANECGRIIRFSDGVGNQPLEGQGGSYQAENGIVRIANHILGGARFGTDPNDSVLDPLCRVWNVDNLYVTDGSFMPTSGSANPTNTIEANAFRVADHLLTRV
jgi:choline dehydrogenase-like flavoprotein